LTVLAGGARQSAPRRDCAATAAILSTCCRFERSPSDLFMIIASDGLFDVMSNDEACRFVLRALITATNGRLGESGVVTKGVLSAVASKLVQLALTKGSLDNVTALVVMLQP
jgi:protein phosphatase 2C